MTGKTAFRGAALLAASFTAACGGDDGAGKNGPRWVYAVDCYDTPAKEKNERSLSTLVQTAVLVPGAADTGADDQYDLYFAGKGSDRRSVYRGYVPAALCDVSKTVSSGKVPVAGDFNAQGGYILSGFETVARENRILELKVDEAFVIEAKDKSLRYEAWIGGESLRSIPESSATAQYVRPAARR